MLQKNGKVHIPINYYDIIIDVFQKRYPDQEAVIFFDDTLQEKSGNVGCTEFFEDGTPPVIFIDANIPYHATVEVLAHELAHVATATLETEEGHTKEWEAVFAWLQEAATERARMLFDLGKRAYEEKRGAA